MVKISVDLDNGLNDRLRKYLWDTYREKMHGKLKEVIEHAVDTYLKERDY